MEKISPQLRHQLAQFQQLQQQAQVLIAQRQQLEVLLRETEQAIQEVEKLAEDATVYRSVGPILAKTSRGEILQKLKEDKEAIDLRLKTIARQEERTIQRIKEMREKIDLAMKEQPGAPGPS
ncbi:MAG: prefoldin subunit beta [Candidatus Hadarchaeales archaeon]